MDSVSFSRLLSADMASQSLPRSGQTNHARPRFTGRNSSSGSSRPDSRLLPTFIKRIMSPSSNTGDVLKASQDRIRTSHLENASNSIVTQTPQRLMESQQCPSRSKNKAPVWEERQTSRSFSLQTFDDNPNREPFDGAHEALRIMNPRHYQMPFGSRVVSIKCSSLQNIYKSLQHGVWACPTNVTKRLEQLFLDRASDAKDKVLFLFSVSGSKQYCGFAEVQGFDPNMTTQLPADDQVYQGSFILRWVYCKFISFDEVRKVDLLHQGDSVTQMWNGMHYDEELGRKVIQAYIEAPHFDNVLACHPTAHMDKAHRRRANHNHSQATGHNNSIGNGGHHVSSNQPHRGPPTTRSTASTSLVPRDLPSNGGVLRGPGPVPAPQQSTSDIELLSRLRRLHLDANGGLPPPPAFGALQERAPKIQTMQVVVNEDGSIRPATLTETASQASTLGFTAPAPAPIQPVAPRGDSLGYMQARHNPMYPFSSLPVASTAMQHQGPISRSLDFPRLPQDMRESHSWPERSLPSQQQQQQSSVQTMLTSQPRTPRYTRTLLQQLGSRAQYSRAELRRFELVGQTVDSFQLEPGVRATSRGHSTPIGVETSLSQDQGLGWVDDLVASPDHSPRAR